MRVKGTHPTPPTLNKDSWISEESRPTETEVGEVDLGNMGNSGVKK